MPKPKSKSRDEIVASAMQAFWKHGFNGTSMDALVRHTGASRHAIYSECGGKDELFQKTLETYQRNIVDTAFLPVEGPDANLGTVEDYFKVLISMAEAEGAPYPGCLVANTMTETGPHDPKVLEAVQFHNARLEQGFLNALRNEAKQDRAVSEELLKELASFLTISTQGMWAFSRSLSDTGLIKQYVSNLLAMIEERISR